MLLRSFYCISQPHDLTASTPLQVMSHQRPEMRSENTQEPSKNGCVFLNHLHIQQDPPLLHIFHCHVKQNLIPLLSTFTFTPPIQPILDLPHTHPPLTSVIRYSRVRIVFFMNLLYLRFFSNFTMTWLIFLNIFVLFPLDL